VEVKKMKNSKKALLFAAGLFMLLGTEGIVMGYGGGGEGTGTSWGQSGTVDPATAQISQTTDVDLEGLFPPGAIAGGTMTIDGPPMTEEEFREMFQSFLEQEKVDAERAAAIMNGLTLTAEGLDLAGQWSQFGLSFVPGVGWVTSGALDAARGGAEAYKKGNDIKGILKATVIDGVVSVTISKLSPLDADKSFNNAKSAFAVLTKGSGTQSPKAAKIAATNLGKFLGKKETEREVGGALSEVLKDDKQVPNKATPPISSLPGVTYKENPMTGVKTYY
jgi:hypothetical protein